MKQAVVAFIEQNASAEEEKAEEEEMEKEEDGIGEEETPERYV